MLYGIAGMKKIIVIGLLTAAFVVLYYLGGVFYAGSEFLLLPVMLLVLLAAVAGPITLLLSSYKFFKGQRLGNLLIWTNGLAIGAYVGYFATKPILKWDTDQRDTSGQIISKRLEDYKVANGHYPADLADLDEASLNEVLPAAYQVNRFSYFLNDKDYHLDIPIPITDRWHWDKSEKIWKYQ
ncbi:membrane hypothetical protein [Imperialibacter sp. 75]|nr:membrane hypothetical protein [Imperialibacter sp. 75]